MIPTFRHILCSIALVCVVVSGIGQVLPVKSGRLWGIIDSKGTLIVKPELDAVSEISPNQAVIVSQGKYGLVDTLGNTLIAPKYTFLKRRNDEVVLINMGGDCQGMFCDGGKWGIINLRLQKTLDPKYNLIREFDAMGLALANVGGRCTYDTCDGGLWGIVDTTATELLPPQYIKVVVVDRTEAYIQNQQGWGLYDMLHHRIAIQPQYEEILRIAPNRITVRMGKQWGVLNDRGDTLVPLQYEGFLHAGMGYLAWKQGLFYGLMDSTGRIMKPARYNQIALKNHFWVEYRHNSYIGLSDTSDRDITRADLKQVNEYGLRLAFASRDGSWGAFDRTGAEIIPLKFDDFTKVNDSLIIMRRGKNYRWFDSNDGTLLKSYLLDSMIGFARRNVSPCKYNGRWAVINKEGDWVVPPKFDEIYVYLQAVKARLGNEIQYFYFDDQGHPSKVKRIVLASDDPDPKLDLTAVTGAANFLGWFANGSGRWGLRNPVNGKMILEPRYSAVQVIPGTNVSSIRGKMKDSPNEAWGLIDHTTGKELCPIQYESINILDFAYGGYARAVFYGSGKYALLNLKGQFVPYTNAAYIGDFVGGIARINLGGQMVWKGEGAFDTICSRVTQDRFTSEMIVSYGYVIGGKWGYIDSTGKWLKPAEYEGALDFQAGLARVKVKDKWGAVDRNFAVVVPAQYDFIERLFKEDGRTLFSVGRDRVAYGFIDEKGEISIKPQFDAVGEFHDGFVRIRQDKLWGYANRRGEIVVQPQYVDAGDFYEGRARVRNQRAWGFIDTLGNNVTPQKYLRAGDFREGLAWVQGEKFFGFVDLQGNMAITPAYSAVGDFSEGLAPAKRKGAYGLIDREGQWVLAPSYYRIGKFHDSLAVVQDMGTFGLIKPSGEFVVKPMYKEIADFHEGLARFRNGLEYGYLDRQGNTVIPSTYSNAGNFSCMRAKIFVQGKWGFIDTAGVEVIPPNYPDVSDFHENRAAVRIGDRWGFIDPLGNLVVPAIYLRVGDFRDGRAAVRNINGDWGLVNPDGTTVIECKYDELGFRKNGLVSIRQGRKWGVINTYGAQMTPCKYDEIGKYNEGLAAVMLRRSIGIVDDRGQVLLDPHFDTVSRIGNLMQVEDDDAIGYLDLNGKWIWEPTK